MDFHVTWQKCLAYQEDVTRERTTALSQRTRSHRQFKCKNGTICVWSVILLGSSPHQDSHSCELARVKFLDSVKILDLNDGLKFKCIFSIIFYIVLILTITNSNISKFNVQLPDVKEAIFCTMMHFRYRKINSFYRGLQTCSNSGKSSWSTGTVFVIFCLYSDFLKEKQ